MTINIVDIISSSILGPQGPQGPQGPAGSNDSANIDFIQSGSGATTRTVQNKLRDVVSVLDFGADNTGANSANAAIQSAVSSGAKEVYFPPGTYLFTGPVEVPVNVSLRGAGKNATIIQAASGIGANFSAVSFSTTPTCKIALFNFLPGAVPSQLPDLSANVVFGSQNVTFASAHSLSDGDIIFSYDPTTLLIANNAGNFIYNETITGSSSGATGTVKRVTKTGSNVKIWYTPVTNTFIASKQFDGSGTSETITGNLSTATANTIILGGSYTTTRPAYHDGEFFTVANTPTTTIATVGQVTSNLYYQAVEMWKLNQPTSSKISDMSIIGAKDNTSVYPYGVSVVGGYGFNAENLYISKFYYTNFEFRLSYQCKFDRCVINQAIEYDKTFSSPQVLSDYYALVLANSQEIAVRQSSLLATRHAVTIGGYSPITNLPNPKCSYLSIEGCELTTSGGVQAADVHGNSFRTSYKNCIIKGGVLVGGDQTTIESCKIYGSDNPGNLLQPATCVQFTELVSTEHYIINNEIFGTGTVTTRDNGLIFLYTQNYYNAVNPGTTVIRGNKIRLKGGSYDGRLMRVSDTGGVGFNGNFNIIFEDNDVYNDKLGIERWSNTIGARISNLVIRNNTFRGPAYVIAMDSKEIEECYVEGNFIERTGSNTYPAIWCGANSQATITGNFIRSSPGGGIYVDSGTNQNLPHVVEHNIVGSFGDSGNINAIKEYNGAFNFFRGSTGGAESRVYFKYNRVLSANNNAETAVRYSNSVTVVDSFNSFHFPTPAGGNWQGFYYDANSAILSFETANTGNANVTGTLEVSGNTIISQNANISGTLNVGSRVSLVAVLNSTATINTTGAITCAGPMRARGDLSVNTATNLYNSEMDIDGRIIGGFGAETTTSDPAQKSWNALPMTIPGSGRYLLLGSDGTGDGAGPGGANYYHAFNFEYNTKRGAGDVTQIAVPFTSSGVFYWRTNVAGVWSSWVAL